MPSSPPLEPIVVTLRDGSHAVIRPLALTDRRALGEAFERMSDESRYRRFLAATPRLSETQLRYLTDVDQRDHVALAAMNGSRIVGVARSIRLKGTEAEPALAIVDDHHGRGLGTELIAALVERSRAQGVRRYRATVLAENVPMLRLLDGIGELRILRAGEALDVIVDLHPSAHEHPFEELTLVST
jgi:RimJ/RimL family protein N-acetyltransferase